MSAVKPEDVLRFWMGDDRSDHAAVATHSPTWFKVDPEFDRAIEEQFGDLVTDVSDGHRAEWESTAEGRLALILVLDQFRRNLFRDTDAMVDRDPEAMRLVREGFEAGHYQRLHLFEKVFFLMPYQHAEDPDVQEEGVERFRALADEGRHEGVEPDIQDRLDAFVTYAERHRDVVVRFGRFPHRNAFLGRKTSEDEQKFLTEKGRF